MKFNDIIEVLSPINTEKILEIFKTEDNFEKWFFKNSVYYSILFLINNEIMEVL